MLWRARQPDGEPPDRGGAAALPLDPGRFDRQVRALEETTRPHGGIEACIAALAEKQTVIAHALAPERLPSLDLAAVERLLDRVFIARRRLYPALAQAGDGVVGPALARLIAASGEPVVALQAFVDVMPGAAQTDRDSLRRAARVRRAAWDFAAELLHYRDPAAVPLMTRWVWNGEAQTGAMREFLRDHESAAGTALGSDVQPFVAVRNWLDDRVRALGVYRDVPLWVDLVLAQAYTGYLRAMTEGHLGADFARGTGPHEQLCKLLGIDAVRGDGRTRVRKEAA